MSQTALEYGLFSTYFAYLQDRLSALLLVLEPNSVQPTMRDRVWFGKFSDNVKKLRKHIAALPDCPQRYDFSVQCRKMLDLAKWRNDRIHATFDDSLMEKGEIALYSRETGTALHMDPDDIREKWMKARELARVWVPIIGAEIVASRSEIQSREKLDGLLETIIDASCADIEESASDEQC